MKTEDIDKRIGMPDVDAEWAKFEREVINNDSASLKRVMLWGLPIAASIALVAGIFLFSHDSNEPGELLAKQTTEQPTLTQQADETASQEVVAEEEVTTEVKTHPQPSGDLRAEATTPVKSQAKENATSTGEPESTVYTCEEEEPQFPGGQKALAKVIKENLRYPELAQEYGVGGRILITFVVDTLGQMNDIHVTKSLVKFNSVQFTQEPVDKQAQLKEQITKQMNQEALRILGIVSEMPRWTPGKQSGKPVCMRYTVPIIFRPSETS